MGINRIENKSLIKKIKNLVKPILWGLPIVGDNMRSKSLQKNYSVEIKLLRGEHHNENTHRSIIHFSLNRAASQYVRKILARCATENSMVTVGWAEYAFDTKFPYLDNLSIREMKKYQCLFKPNGYLFSVFGGMVEGIEELEKYRIILMVRDPRDVLVSEYYSYGYAHKAPSRRGNKYDDFMKLRLKTLHTTIDQYAFSECDRLLNTYQRYIDKLLNRYSQVYVTRYEDMIADYQNWLTELLNYFELKASSALLQSLFEESRSLKPEKENIFEHNRKGMAGDYKEKLQAETIDFLNNRFFPILEKFGYK